MTHIAKSDQVYERRQIVAKMGSAGTFIYQRRKFRIWQFMTFYTGPNTPAIAAEFSRQAPTDEQGFIRIDGLKEGEILVDPGFVYRKIPMTGNIMAEHLKRMRVFRPRDIVQHAKDTDAGAVDLGIIDMRTKQ